jgi:hypothetical protein
MTQADDAWWEQMRAKGRGYFVFREGILRNGSRVGFSLVFLGGLTSWCLGGCPSILGLLITWASLTACFGTLIGFVLWKQHERNYHQQRGFDHVD